MNNTNWDNVPDYITKEQLCKLCHISKRTALFLLRSGRIPCTLDMTKKTHSYKIKKEDAMEYLAQREQFPERYKAPEGWYMGAYDLRFSQLLPDYTEEQFRQFWQEELRGRKDVLTAAEVAKIIGYQKSTVNEWCTKGWLKSFLRGRANYIPKVFLVEFLCSHNARTIRNKSSWHQSKMQLFFREVQFEEQPEEEFAEGGEEQ